MAARVRPDNLAVTRRCKKICIFTCFIINSVVIFSCPSDGAEVFREEIIVNTVYIRSANVKTYRNTC